MPLLFPGQHREGSCWFLVVLLRHWPLGKSYYALKTSSVAVVSVCEEETVWTEQTRNPCSAPFSFCRNRRLSWNLPLLLAFVLPLFSLFFFPPTASLFWFLSALHKMTSQDISPSHICSIEYVFIWLHWWQGHLTLCISYSSKMNYLKFASNTNVLLPYYYYHNYCCYHYYRTF